jgi:hypothetical protein
MIWVYDLTANPPSRSEGHILRVLNEALRQSKDLEARPTAQKAETLTTWWDILNKKLEEEAEHASSIAETTAHTP